MNQIPQSAHSEADKRAKAKPLGACVDCGATIALGRRKKRCGACVDAHEAKQHTLRRARRRAAK